MNLIFLELRNNILSISGWKSKGLVPVVGIGKKKKYTSERNWEVVTSIIDYVGTGKREN